MWLATSWILHKINFCMLILVYLHFFVLFIAVSWPYVQPSEDSSGCVTPAVFRNYTDDQYFAISLVVKNVFDLPEWIEYHRRLGCTKFYIFDHNSTVPLLGQIKNEVDSGLVEYFYIIHTKDITQHWVYNTCIERFKSRHFFMAFIDADEFINVVDKSKNIPEILHNYENYGGLVLNWKMFGSSGHIERPEGGVLSNYNKCYDDFHVKTIANTKHVMRVRGNPHTFKYDNNKYAVDTNYHRIDYPFNPGNNMKPPAHLYDIMYINHYSTKSRAEFKRKFEDGCTRTSNFIDVVDSKSVHTCPYLTMPPAL